MKRAFAILIALCGSTVAQTTNITVVADSGRVIRTNFSLTRAQVSDLSGASFAISNITGLQTALDGKLATNGSAASLTNFPASILLTNSSASAFPSALLRTNGDGSGLTNLPNANLTNATGVLGLANGGTGSTNASNARTALGLGSAATNPDSAFQPASSALTNLAAGDASGLTNLPNANLGTATGVLGIANGGSGATNAEAARTNFGLVWSGLTNADAAGFRSALSLGTAATNDASAFQPASANLTNLAANNGGSLTNVSVDLTTVLPAYSNNAGKVLSVAAGATNVEWIAVSNTVTDASTLTNFPASILQTNSALTNFPAGLLRTNGSAAGLTGFPTLNQNTTGTASNVTGVVAIANGGSGQTTAAAAIEAFLPAYSGNANRILALNSNANGLVWTTNAGGGGGLTSPVAIIDGGTGATNATTALQNLTIVDSSKNNSVVIRGTLNGTNSIAIGAGQNATATNNGVAVGSSSSALNSAVAVGLSATSAATGVSIGANAFTTNQDSVALGSGASITGAGSTYSIAIGGGAKITGADKAVQIGLGTNTASDSIAFFNWGNVSTAEWGALANSSTAGRYVITNTAAISGSKTFVAYDGTNYTTNTVTFSNGIITGWTQ